jgi:hypothetical protein
MKMTAIFRAAHLIEKPLGLLATGGMDWLDIVDHGHGHGHGHDRGRRHDHHCDYLSFGRIHPVFGVSSCFSRTSLLESPF